MVTIYDLLEVDENASKEEIEKAYQKLILEYHIDPALSEQENKENEMILNKLKMAYGILIDDEKRKKYDKDLAQKRAEALIKNVSTNSNNVEMKNKEELKDDSEFYDDEDDNEYDFNNKNNESNFEDAQSEDVVLTQKEKNEARKEAKKQFKKNLMKAQKMEEEYNEAYNKAYKDYLKKIGYKSEGALKLQRIKITLITIMVVVVLCIILWYIPPIKQMLINLYEENFIIKTLIDIFSIFVNAIMSIFKN